MGLSHRLVIFLHFRVLFSVFFQDDIPPAEIVVDQYTITHGEYLRVTLRADQPFRGFLIKAVDILDYRNKSEYSRYYRL